MEEQLVRCPCREVMKRQEEVTHPDGAAYLEFYACPADGRKLVLWWELTGGGVTPEQRSWVEKEVARRGSFFPSDYSR